MAFTIVPDINNLIINYVGHIEDVIKLCLVNKIFNNLITKHIFYLELSKLKSCKKDKKLGSYEIIRYYYKYGMVNIISHYKLDHHLGILLACKYGHIQILDNVYNSINDFPYAKSTFNMSIIQCQILACKNHKKDVILWLDKKRLGLINQNTNIANLRHLSHNQYIIRGLVEFSNNDNNNLAKIQYLFIINPQIITLIIKYAIKYGKINILKQFSEKIFPYLSEIVNDSNQTLSDCENIHQILDWCEENKNKIKISLYPKEICAKGKISILDRIVKNKLYIPQILVKCVFSYGAINVLEWYFANGLDNEIPSGDFYNYAGNNINALNWLRDNKKVFPKGKHMDFYEKLIYDGQIKSLVWYMETYPTVKLILSCNLIDNMIRNKHFHMIDWILEQREKFLIKISPDSSYMQLIRINHIDYSFERIYFNTIFRELIIMGRVDILKKYENNKYFKNLLNCNLQNIYNFVISKGHIEMIKYLQSMGINFNTETQIIPSYAILEIHWSPVPILMDYLPIVKWIIENRSRISENMVKMIISNSISTNNFHIIDYLKKINLFINISYDGKKLL